MGIFADFFGLSEESDPDEMVEPYALRVSQSEDILSDAITEAMASHKQLQSTLGVMNAKLADEDGNKGCAADKPTIS